MKYTMDNDETLEFDPKIYPIDNQMVNCMVLLLLCFVDDEITVASVRFGKLIS